MRYLKMLALALLPVVMLAMTGCGGSGSTAGDPFAPTKAQPTPDPVFPNVSTATGKITLSLTTDVPTVDVDNGQVMAIAKVKAGETPVQGMTVLFKVVAPSDLATIETATATTDSTGTASTRVTTGNRPSTTNVILSATITVANHPITTNATFQIIRGGGVIMFTDKAGQAPGGQSDLYPSQSQTVEPGAWTYLQLIPVKVTDSNGNPRVGVPVTLSVFNMTTLASDPNITRPSVDFVVQPGTDSNTETVVTDSAGQAIFSSRIHLDFVAAKQTTVVNVIFKGVTNDAIPVSAYLGTSYSVTGKEQTQPATTP